MRTLFAILCCLFLMGCVEEKMDFKSETDPQFTRTDPTAQTAKRLAEGATAGKGAGKPKSAVAALMERSEAYNKEHNLGSIADY